MKILHVADSYQPQLGYQETALAECQAKVGHEVHVITGNLHAAVMDKVGYGREANIGQSNVNGVSLNRLPIRFELPGEGNRIWLSGLEKAIKRVQPEFVHVHNLSTFTAWRTARLQAFLGFKLVCDSHMALFNSMPERSLIIRSFRRVYYRFFVSFFLPKILKRTCAIVAIGEPERDYLVSHFGIERDGIAIIRLGADRSLFRPDPELRQSYRESLGVSKDDVVLLHAGSIRSSKRIHDLISSGLRLVAADLPVRVLVVGSGDQDYLSKLRAQVQAAGAADHFLWRDFAPRSELAGFLNAADVAVWPGDQSNTFIEAMAVGLPLVTVESDYARNLAGEAGRYFDFGDVQALTSTLKCLIEDRICREQISSAALLRVENELNWESVSERFLELCV